MDQVNIYLHQKLPQKTLLNKEISQTGEEQLIVLKHKISLIKKKIQETIELKLKSKPIHYQLCIQMPIDEKQSYIWFKIGGL